MPRTSNAIVIGAPLDVVWAAMNDLERWPELFTEYASIEILGRDGSATRFRLTTHPDPEHDGHVWSWVSERTIDEATHTSRAHRIETGPFEYMKINWSFTAVEGGTRMEWRQDFAMKASAPASDGQAAAYIDRNSRAQMAAIKDRIEGHAGSSAGVGAPDASPV